MRKCPEKRAFIPAHIGARLRRTVAAKMPISGAITHVPGGIDDILPGHLIGSRLCQLLQENRLDERNE